MNLYLVRHAQAEPGHDDASRHLTEQGWADARRLGDALRAMNLRVREVWHSDLDRAVETARAVAAALHGQPVLKVQQGLRPEDRTKPMARMIGSFNDDLMIVGHEPFLGKLAARLVAGKPRRALLCLDKPSCACLTDAVEGEWLVTWMLARPTLPVVLKDAPGAGGNAGDGRADADGARDAELAADDVSEGSDHSSP